MKDVMLITGASKGIGLALVVEALEAGYKVAATSRNKDELTKVVAEKLNNDKLMEQFLPIAMPFETKAMQQAVDATVAKFGRLDILVNNAGYAVLGALEDISLDKAKANFDVNVFGLLEMTQIALPALKNSGHGKIINLASISSSVTGPTQGIYAATKAAVLMMSETMSMEFAADNIQVTAICPSGVRTDFLDAKSMDKVTGQNEVAQKTLQALADFNHNQSGNPVLVARAILAVLKMEQMPMRLYLGRPAMKELQAKLKEVADNAQEYIDLSLSIDD